MPEDNGCPPSPSDSLETDVEMRKGIAVEAFMHNYGTLCTLRHMEKLGRAVGLGLQKLVQVPQLVKVASWGAGGLSMDGKQEASAMAAERRTPAASLRGVPGGCCAHARR